MNKKTKTLASVLLGATALLGTFSPSLAASKLGRSIQSSLPQR